jgi:heat-inducible transcriptional repressor
MLDDRKLAVLRAVVEDYVETREAVGSRALVERHALDVSPATVRNDMAVLEDEGYITQLHTSAGRIPTDKGYRLFVDRLSEVKPLSVGERRAIDRFMDGALDLDDVVGRTVRLLAQLTRQVAVVQYPSLSRSEVRHVELVALGGSRLLLVLITNSGRVEQRVVEVSGDLSDALVGELRAKLNAAVVGKRLADAVSTVATVDETFAAADRPLADAVVATLLEALAARVEERVAVAGAANLTGFGRDFTTAVAPVLEALEEHVVLLRLLGEGADGGTGTTGAVTVRIGAENTELTSTSVIATDYGPAGSAVARLGIVGPTRMDYPATIGRVSAVARYVGRILDAG